MVDSIVFITKFRNGSQYVEQFDFNDEKDIIEFMSYVSSMFNSFKLALDFIKLYYNVDKSYNLVVVNDLKNGYITFGTSLSIYDMIRHRFDYLKIDDETMMHMYSIAKNIINDEEHKITFQKTYPFDKLFDVLV
jgi:hypothetical protein